jgi:hypothetical protein
MRCFYHPERDASGLCSECGKAGCSECLRDVGRALLCKGCIASYQLEAEQTARAAQEEAEREARQAKRRIRRNWIITAIASVFVAPLIAASLYEDPSVPPALKILLVPLGVVVGPYLVWGDLVGSPTCVAMVAEGL